MGNWKSQLKADPTEWLLEEDNPSVRYLTLVDILEKPAGDPEVKKARADIMAKGGRSPDPRSTGRGRLLGPAGQTLHCQVQGNGMAAHHPGRAPG